MAYQVTLARFRNASAQPGFSQWAWVCPVSGQSALEELVNSLTHGLGLVLSLAGSILLLLLAARVGGVWNVAGCAVFCTTLVLAYTASTLYHGSRSIWRKKFLLHIDQAMVYLLIAGTYTPFAFIPLNGGWGWALFGVVWGVAVLAIGIKILLLDRFKLASIPVYLSLGWLCLIALVPLLNTVPLAGLVWLLTGGLAYTFGIVFLLWRSLAFNHGLWHLLVLTGSICHYIAISRYVLPLGA